MAYHSQNGFTLVEVVLALAVTSSLLFIVFTNQAQIRNRSQLSDAIEQTVTVINEIKNEAQSGIQAGAPVPTNTNGPVFFGKLLEFNAGTNTINVSDLLYSSGKTLNNPTNQYTFTIPWEVCYISCKSSSKHQFIIFHQSSLGSKLLVYVAPSGTSKAKVLKIANYHEDSNPYSWNNNGNPTNLQFKDNYGLSATISINAIDGGAVTRTYQ